MKVVTLTLNPAIDKSAKIEGLKPENKLKCFDIQHQAGGGGINISRVLKRLGVENHCVFPSGGNTGQLLNELLLKENIIVKSIKVDTWTRENFSVFDTNSNLQYRFGMPGNDVSAEKIKEIEDYLSSNLEDGDILILSGSLPENLPSNYYSKLIAQLKNKSIKIVLDTSGPALKNSLEESVFLIKPNQLELKQLANKESLTDKEMEEFATSLVKSGKSQYVVVSLGANGALIVSKEGFQYQKAPEVVVKSTIGAGDSMVAGLIYAFINNESQKNIIKWGVSSGAAATMNEGSNLAQKENIEQLFNSLGK